MRLGNTVDNNIIGLTSAGTAVLGNEQAGVADTAPGTMIGPGNVISANLIGVLISGATATNVTVIGNLIGTDSTGEADLGNAQAGVDIESATGVIVEGNGQGSQVISGNLVGVEDQRSVRRLGNLVEGNFIGIDKAGTADRGNAERRGADRGSGRQHGRRNDRGGPQRDLGQSLGNPDRRFHGDGQPRRGKLHRHRRRRGRCPWATRSTASFSAPARRTTRSAGRLAARATRSRSTWRPACS